MGLYNSLSFIFNYVATSSVTWMNGTKQSQSRKFRENIRQHLKCPEYRQNASSVIEARIFIIETGVSSQLLPYFFLYRSGNSVYEPELVDSTTISPVHLGSASESGSGSITICAFTVAVELSEACPWKCYRM